MANLAEFVFLDATSTSTTSNTFYVPYGADEVTIQVKAASGSADITVKGKTDRENGEFVTISAINLSGYSLVSKITENGIYCVAASGIREMQIVNGGTAGSVTVFGAAVGGD